MTTQTDNIPSGADESALTRSGDPNEFDEELAAALKDPNDPGNLDVPPGLVRRLLAAIAGKSSLLIIEIPQS